MKHFLTCFILLLSMATQAQINYSVYPIAYNPDPFTIGNVVPGVSFDDIYSGVIPIGFSFNFYGFNYDSLIVGSNGAICFNDSLAGMNCPWSTTSSPYTIINPNNLYNSIMAPWHDINPGIGGSIKYAVNGSAPFRRFVVSFYQIPMFSCTSSLFSQQIILYETTNIIETHILNKPLCSSWNNGNAVHGIVNQNGTNADIVLGRNNTPWTASNDGMRFDPGTGIYMHNLVTGKVFQDLNGNCIPDSNEIGIANRPVIANSGDFYTYTDANGNYALHVDTGTFNIGEIPPLYYAVACPSTGVYTINFPAQFDTSANNNFSDSILYYCSDLTIDIGTINMSRCMTEWVGITYCNNGTVGDTAVVIQFALNDSIQILNSPANITNLGNNNYEVVVGNINPGQCGNIAFQVQIGCDSLGTVYCIQAYITGAIAYDCDTTNNLSNDCHGLIGSWDPNDLQVAAQNFINEGFVMADDIDDNDELSYLIRFQNTGTDTAYNVKIKDMIPSQLNASTIVMGASSHNYNWVVINGELIIDFINIHLPDSFTNALNSNGFVKFKIQQNAGNLLGTIIVNQAGIYFDSNPAVVTNQTFNTIPLSTGITNAYINKIVFMPNPVNDKLQLVLPFESTGNTSIEIIDALGKSVQIQRLDNTIAQVDCSGLSKGIYLARVTHKGQLYNNFKFIKE